MYLSMLTVLYLGKSTTCGSLEDKAAIFIAESGSKMDGLVHLPPQIHIESQSNVNLCSDFHLKVYLHHAEPFKKLDGSQVSSLFWSNNRQHMAYVQDDFFLGTENLRYYKDTYVSRVLATVLQCQWPMLLVFPWCPSCCWGTRPRFHSF